MLEIYEGKLNRVQNDPTTLLEVELGMDKRWRMIGSTGNISPMDMVGCCRENEESRSFMNPETTYSV